MAGAGDRERHEGWIRGGNRGGVGWAAGRARDPRSRDREAAEAGIGR
jgi:hypothetical protein